MVIPHMFKKFIALSLFSLLSLVSVGAAETRVGYDLCSRGPEADYWIPDEVGCPNELLAPDSANVGDTTFDTVITADIAGETLHHCTKNVSEATSAIDIVNGTGCLPGFSGSATSSVGVNTVNHTGATELTQYCTYYATEKLGYVGIYSNVGTVDCFSTTSGAPALQGIFVSNTGIDAGGCGSDSQACATYAYAKTQMVAGDDLWFKSGHEFQTRVLADWGCDGVNRYTIGTYWMNNGTETQGLPSGASGRGRPDISQSLWEAATIEDDFSIGTFDDGKKNEALIEIFDNCTNVENIAIRYSHGLGIQVQNNGVAGSAIIDNILVFRTARSGYTANRDEGSNTVTNSWFEQTSACWGWNELPCQSGGTWSSGTKHVGSDNNVFQFNTVKDTWGEGMGNSERGDNNLVADNDFIRIRSAALYANGNSNTTFERNRVIGCADLPEADCWPYLDTVTQSGPQTVRSLHRTGSLGNTGNPIRMSFENSAWKLGSPYMAIGNIWRNNLVISTSASISIGAESSVIGDPLSQVGGSFLGNTFINVDQWWWNGVNPNNKPDTLAATIISHNIFGERAPGTTLVDCADSAAVGAGVITVDYNLFAVALVNDQHCDDGVGNVIGTPDLARSDWTAVPPNWYEPFDNADLVLGPASNAKDAGDTSVTNLIEDWNQVNRPLNGSNFDMGGFETATP